jgi:hypothetical protein
MTRILPVHDPDRTPQSVIHRSAKGSDVDIGCAMQATFV